MNQKVKLNEMFLEWFRQTNPHLFKKGVKGKDRNAEMTEYVNDVLQEHMEVMARYDDASGRKREE